MKTLPRPACANVADAPAAPRRRLLRAACGCAGVALAGPWLLAGCGPRDDGAAVAARDFDKSASCDLDGMVLADYPGPKGQIVYAGDDKVHWYCDTVELLAQLLRPEQVRPVRGAWVQDMGKADWNQPRGHWIAARDAFYVLGSKRRGSMGPTAATFADEAAAQAHIAQHGGKLLRFAQITPDMTDLSGGALHDSKM